MNTTPAPWRVDHEPDLDGNVFLVDEQGVTIAKFFQPHDTWNALDNAKLCAAAHGMRDALQRLLAAVDTKPANRRERHIALQTGVARAALAKADEPL